MSKNVQTYKKGEALPQWALTQKKTFTNWCNQYLKPEQALSDLGVDFGDGVKLIILLENLTESSMGRYNAKPKLRVHSIENASKAVKFILSQGIKLVSIGPEDIVDGDIKLILGLVWMLIQHRYTLMNRKQGVDVNLKNDLLKWIRRKVQPYPVPQPTNFKQSWQDGKVLFALVDSLKNQSTKGNDFDFKNLTGKPIDDVKVAIAWAQDKLDVPGILDPTDMVDFPDELSNITYLAGFLKYATAEPDPTDPSKSSITDWKKFVVNKPAKFSIVARKEDGEQQPQGGDAFDVKLIGDRATEFAAEIKDNQNGVYDVAFLPTAIGKLLGNVALSETSAPLQGSPLHSYVIPDGDLKFEAFGPNLHHGHAKRPLHFNMKVTDLNSNPLQIPTDCFEVTLSSPSDKLNAAVKPIEPGLYECSFQLPNPADYKVKVSLFGDEVGNYDLSCHDPINLSLISVFFQGEGIDGGELPEHPVKFVAELTSGNKPLQVNLDDVQFTIDGPFSNLAPSVSLDGPGKFVVEYFPKVMGDYDIAVLVHNGKLTEAHPSFTIGGLKCVLSGPGAKGGSIKKPLKFKVGFYDSNGKVAGSAFKALDVDNSGKLEKNEVKDFITHISSIPKVKEMFDKLLTNYSGGPEGVTDALVEAVFEKFDEDKSGDITMSEFKSWGSSIPFIETLFAVTNGNLEVKITGPDSSLNPSVKESASEPGAFDVEYQPTLPGQYQIEIFVNHKSVLGEPVVAHCFDTDFHPKVTGHGIEKPAYTKRPLTNNISILSDKNEPLDIPIKLLSVELDGPTKVTPPIQASDKTPAAFHIDYNITEPGQYALQLEAFGEPLGEPIKLAINDRLPTSTDTSAVVIKDEFIQNKKGEFKIVARTADKKDQDVGGDHFTVKLVNDHNVEYLSMLEDNDDGTYTVSFTPTEYGLLNVEVRLEDVPLKDHPLKVYVLPEHPYVINVRGKGIESGYKNFPQRLFAEVLDSVTQTPLEVPLNCFDFKIAPPTDDESLNSQIIPSQDNFEVSWTPQNVGDYKLGVSFFGKDAWDLPVIVPITDKPLTDAKNSSIVDLETYVAAVPATFTIAAHTAEDKQQTVGGDIFNVNLTSDDGQQIPVTIDDNNNGTYTVKFTPNVVGKLNVDAKINDESLKNLPTTSWVLPAWESSSTSIEGPKEGNTYKPIVFTVTLSATPDPTLALPPSVFAVSYSTPSTAATSHPLTVTAKSPTTYELAVTFTEPTKYELNFTMFSGLLAGCPLALSLTNTHPALLCSVVDTEGLDNAIVRVEKTFNIKGQDVKGDPLNGAEFVVKIKGVTAEVPVKVTELGDGVYTAKYKPKEAGKLKISVTLDGQNIVGSPFTVYAVPNDCLNTLMKGKGCYKGSVNEKLQFEIVAYLQSNLVKKPVPLSSIAVVFTGPEEVKPHITPSSQKGIYNVSYSVQTAGIYTIKAKVFGRDIGEAQPEIVVKDKYNK